MHPKTGKIPMFLTLITDGSKELESGHSGLAVYIPHLGIEIKKRTTDNLSVYVVELIAIFIHLNWIENQNGQNYLVASDNMTALLSID